MWQHFQDEYPSQLQIKSPLKQLFLFPRKKNPQSFQKKTVFGDRLILSTRTNYEQTLGQILNSAPGRGVFAPKFDKSSELDKHNQYS